MHVLVHAASAGDRDDPDRPGSEWNLGASAPDRSERIPSGDQNIDKEMELCHMMVRQIRGKVNISENGLKLEF